MPDIRKLLNSLIGSRGPSKPELPVPPEVSRRVMMLGIAALAIAVGFAKPMYELVVFASKSQLFSHILLIPFVSAYLLWVMRARAPVGPVSGRGFAAFPLLAGLALLAFYWSSERGAWKQQDYLALMALVYVCFVAAAALALCGAGFFRKLAFPLVFLLFMVPFPIRMEESIEAFLQLGSAEAAHLFLWLSGMPFNREGLVFRLPGFSMQVAPECSGIHSTLVLFVTSTVAGYLFLRSGWRRLGLSLLVIPLALLRNGLRIFTLGQLCIQIDPNLINSIIHRRGGPFFFALSLIPFFLILIYLWKTEAGKTTSG
jgi:exosortase C (VPDSG-CTERM-specific)